MENMYRLTCPECREARCYSNHLDNALVCQRCKATFPKLNGVVDLLREESENGSWSHQLLEWPLLVRVYESKLWRGNPLLERLARPGIEQEINSILDAANLQGAERVLDLGCGTGTYARLLARHVPQGRVLAVDSSVAKLEYAAERAAQEGLNNIEFMRADALQIPLPDNSFDVINCYGALHLYSDVDQVLAEIQRLLKPGGRFTTAVFRQSRGWFANSAEWLNRKAVGAKTMSRGWLMVHLHKAGLDDSQACRKHGPWLVMRSTKP